MEAMIAFIAIDVEVLLLAYAYRRREDIRKWLNAPYYADNDRALSLTRRKEDIEKELAWIEANKK